MIEQHNEKISESNGVCVRERDWESVWLFEREWEEIVCVFEREMILMDCLCLHIVKASVLIWKTPQDVSAPFATTNFLFSFFLKQYFCYVC